MEEYSSSSSEEEDITTMVKKDLYRNVHFTAQLRIDVLDTEGIWNSGRVMKVDGKRLLIRYDGWDASFDEWIHLNTNRIAPYHLYTYPIKCWAKLKHWPWWPAITMIRVPGTPFGADCLEKEDKLFVEFLDNQNERKRSRCWLHLKDVESFRRNYKEKVMKRNGKSFDYSLFLAHESKAHNINLDFCTGTLPSRNDCALAVSIHEKYINIGPREWVHMFLKSSNFYDDFYAANIKPPNNGKEKGKTVPEKAKKSAKCIQEGFTDKPAVSSKKRGRGKKIQKRQKAKCYSYAEDIIELSSDEESFSEGSSDERPYEKVYKTRIRSRKSNSKQNWEGPDFSYNEEEIHSSSEVTSEGEGDQQSDADNPEVHSTNTNVIIRGNASFAIGNWLMDSIEGVK